MCIDFFGKSDPFEQYIPIYLNLCVPPPKVNRIRVYNSKNNIVMTIPV